MDVSKLFRAYGLYNPDGKYETKVISVFQSSFELTGYITSFLLSLNLILSSFKALSSLRVI